MKLFGNFEAVKFYEENLIYITNDKYLYYVYNPKYDVWRKHRNAGNENITVENYNDVSRIELADAMNGVFPKKETDFMRLCEPEGLWIRDMMDLLEEDYMKYMSDWSIKGAVHGLLLGADVTHKAYMEIKKLFDEAIANLYNIEKVQKLLEELRFRFLGKQINEKRNEIVDDYYGSSYFHIMPVRVVDYENTCESDNLSKMTGIVISIEEDYISDHLYPFLSKHFDNELDANKNRIEYEWTDENGVSHKRRVEDFEWYLTYNFFTFDSIERILADIRDTIDALSSGLENEFTAEVTKYKSAELVIDFYNRFIYRMEYMMRVATENGHDLISFMGP